jgi:hypothetical protein
MRSLRRTWTMYEKLLVEDGISRCNQLPARATFYSGVRCVLKR